MSDLEKQSNLIKLKSYLSGLATIPGEEWEKLSKDAFIRTYDKKDFFVRFDEKPEAIAYIVSGVFRVYYTSEDGIEKTMVFRSTGQFISAYSSFLTNQRSPYTIQAITDSEVIYIPLSTYKKLEAGHDCWQVISGKYAQYLFVEKEERERSLLLMTAFERYEQFLKDYHEVVESIPNYMIASYLGITPESLSRILRN